MSAETKPRCVWCGVLLDIDEISGREYHRDAPPYRHNPLSHKEFDRIFPGPPYGFVSNSFWARVRRWLGLE